jgi:hypothetical protein
LKVVNAREVVVDHYGTRTPGPETQKLVTGYGAGTAAALYKHVRLGDAVAMRVYLGFLWSTVRRVSVNILRGQRPLGLGYLAAFVNGSIQSYKFRIDRTSRQYARRA